MSNPSQAQRIDDAIKERLQIVDFGLQAQQFLSSPLGKYLLDRAVAEVAAGVEELKKVDPTDTRSVMRLQGEVWRAESFMYWLGDVIREGTQVREQLIAEEKQALGLGGDPQDGDVTGA